VKASRSDQYQNHLISTTPLRSSIRQRFNRERWDINAPDQKAFMKDLKPVYRAVTKKAAEFALDKLEEKWSSLYPILIKSWLRKWENLSIYFKYLEALRKIIYTTNAVEAIHCQFRKRTKTKGAFPNENSLLKLLYAGILNAIEKWTMPI
jgi:putative transposase